MYLGYSSSRIQLCYRSAETHLLLLRLFSPSLPVSAVRCIAVLSPRETFKTLRKRKLKKRVPKKLKPQPLLSLESVILAGKWEWPRLQVRSDGGLWKDFSWVTKRYVASHFKVMIFLTFFPYYAVRVLMNEWRYRSFVAVKKWRPSQVDPK